MQFNVITGIDSKAAPPISSIIPIKSTKLKIPSTIISTTMSSSLIAVNKSQAVKTKKETFLRQFQNVTEKMHFDFERLASLLQVVNFNIFTATHIESFNFE